MSADNQPAVITKELLEQRVIISAQLLVVATRLGLDEDEVDATFKDLEAALVALSEHEDANRQQRP